MDSLPSEPPRTLYKLVFFFFLMLPLFFLWNFEQFPLSINIIWLNRQNICCYKSQGTQWCTNLWSPLFWDVVSEWHHLRGWTVLKCGCTSQNPGFSHLPSLLQNIKLRGASSAPGKGLEDGGLAYAKAGSGLRSLPGNSRASTPKTRVCLLSALCFHLHLWLYGGLSPTTSLWKKS